MRTRDTDKGHTYQTYDPKGWCGDPRRGAALGRRHVATKPETFSGPIHMRRLRMYDGDYDVNGTYFGHVQGTALYWVSTSDGEIDFVLRALDG